MYRVRRFQRLLYRLLAGASVRLGLLDGLFLKPLTAVRGRRPLELLFLCKGNICRSPYAAASFSKLLQEAAINGVTVTSAGLETVTGKAADPVAITVAGERGVNLCAHGTQPITGELLQRADLVLVMEPFHLRQVRRLMPEALTKTIYLGAMNAPSGKEFIIADPYGKPVQHFVETFNEIDHALGLLLEEILKPGP